MSNEQRKIIDESLQERVFFFFFCQITLASLAVWVRLQFWIRTDSVFKFVKMMCLNKKVIFNK